MRNVFDQYTQIENRVTHALVTALNEDRKLLKSFLCDVIGCEMPPSVDGLMVVEQMYPGEAETSEEESERRGIPDAWITDEDNWCLLIENKVQAIATADQLERHFAVARRRGFGAPIMVLLTIRPPAGSIPERTRIIKWHSLYRWLSNQAAGSNWARHVAEFLEILEARMIEQKQLTAGTLTAFNGFPFGRDNPYTYLEAKRVLGLAMSEFRKRRDLRTLLGPSLDLPGRGAITGKEDERVWDLLYVGASKEARDFTKCLHLTLGIQSGDVHAMLTIPNGLKRSNLQVLRQLGIEGFRSLVGHILKNMLPVMKDCPGMEPRLRAVQRRYPTQRSTPFNDAVIDFDLRTAFDRDGSPKYQPQWLDAVFDCLSNKNSNFQVQIGASFPYRTCPAINEPKALDHVARSWIACGPLIDLAAVT